MNEERWCAIENACEKGKGNLSRAGIRKSLQYFRHDSRDDCRVRHVECDPEARESNGCVIELISRDNDGCCQLKVYIRPINFGQNRTV